MTRRVVAAVALAGILVIAGCSPGDPALETEPRPDGEPLVEVDTSEMRLPSAFEGLPILEPAWDTPPKYADGVYLSAGERDGYLEFTAVDVTGRVLWSAQRPPSCSGFTLTTGPDGRALAVLTDLDSTDDALTATTASAYDLHTGELAWGPVEVPGPHLGPGLVFASSPEEVLGTIGPRLALDPATGAPAQKDAEDLLVLGEFDGTAVLATPQGLEARSTATGSAVWDRPWQRGDPADLVADSGPGAGLVTLSSQGHDQDATILDLADGASVHESVIEAALDASTGSMVVIDEQGLHSYDEAGQAQWSQSVTPGTTIAAAGGVLLYLREDQAIRVHNVLTGEVAQGYDPDSGARIVTPLQITANGAALLHDGDRYLIASIPPPPS